MVGSRQAQHQLRSAYRLTPHSRTRHKGSSRFRWGAADFPTPRISLLLSVPNASQAEGENAANYENAEYDRLYRRSNPGRRPRKQKV